jgi:broad specificity phosphatase PhoE
VTSSNTVLWIVRHGESTWNVAQRIQGQLPGSVLTALGRSQADRAAVELSKRPIAVVYVSDLERCLQTAAPIAQAHHLDVSIDPRLRERSFGKLEGLPSSVLTVENAGLTGDSVFDVHAHPPGGESIQALWDRSKRFLEGLGHPDGDGEVVVVSHGGTIRAMRAVLRGMGPSSMGWEPVENAQIFREELPFNFGGITGIGDSD